MKNKTIAFLGCLLLTSCSGTPVLEPYIAPTAIPESQKGAASVWADNGQMHFMMIKKVDGKRSPSRNGAGFPYSVGISPGKHTLGIYLSDLSDFNPFLHGGKYADLELQVEVAAGHSYALRHRTDGQRVQAYLTDLGDSVQCRYEIAGTMRQGYVPVALKCE